MLASPFRFFGISPRSQLSQIFSASSDEMEMSHRVRRFLCCIQFFIFANSAFCPGGWSPRIESSQYLIFFPFPEIQQRLDLKCSRAVRQSLKIGDPVKVLGGLSKHLEQLPWKYFFQRTFLLQLVCPDTKFQRSLEPRAKF